MKLALPLTTLLFFLLSNASSAAGLEKFTITLHSNERFDLVQANKVKFKFKPLSEKARGLEITSGASSLGVAYLGQVRLKENITALSALRSVADQIGKSLGINFGVIADSNTSDALKTNELILLYHPSATITLALSKPTEESDYEIICTYALKDLVTEQANEQTNAQVNNENKATKSASETPAIVSEENVDSENTSKKDQPKN